MRTFSEPQAQHGFQLTELPALESAAVLQETAEGVELERGHRFEDVDLGYECFHDGEHASHRLDGGEGLAGLKLKPHPTEFMQNLLEPEFVSLMDDDEEHLVVLLRIGLQFLQLQQFRYLQI